MKKKSETTLSVLKKIAKDISQIRSLVALLVASDTLVKSINETPSNVIVITERPDLKTSELLNLCRTKFKVWSWYDDAKLDVEFPAPKTATTRYFLKEKEPDKETLGLSVNQAEAKGFKNGITIRERMLLELAYFAETGQHMDVKGVTFCTGSRNSGGLVPCAGWDDDEFRIYWYFVGYSYSGYGIRSAVPLSSSSFNPSDEVEKAIELVKSNGYRIFKEL